MAVSVAPGKFLPYLNKTMVISMDLDHGVFTAEDCKTRARRHCLTAPPVKGFVWPDDGLRGDHDLNPDLAGYPAPPGGARPASVLIGIVDRKPAATVILTRRADHLSSHAGQIAFPGGRVEQTDGSFIGAALREAHEEIGLASDLVEPIGFLDSYQTRTGYRIAPLVSIIQPDFTLRADEREVADIFEVPLGFLMTASNYQRHCRQWEGRERYFYAIPYGEKYIWGATAGILRIMYERLYAE